MVTYSSPTRNKRDLQVFGPRLEVQAGLPLVRTPSGLLSPHPRLPNQEPRFSKMPALIDTGARLTLLTPEAIARVGLPKVNEMQLARAGGITDNVGVHVASMHFPQEKLATIARSGYPFSLVVVL